MLHVLHTVVSKHTRRITTSLAFLLRE